MNGTNNTSSVRAVVGERIKNAREAAGRTRTKFADMLCSANSAPNSSQDSTLLAGRLKQWEYGNNPIDLEWIPAICEVANCDVGYLFGDYDEPKRTTADVVAATGLSEKAANRLICWNKLHLDYTAMLSIFLESPYFVNILHHAIRITETKLGLASLRKDRQDWLRKSFSGSSNCRAAINYAGDDSTADKIREKEMEHAYLRLYLNDNITFLIQEAEGLSLEKAGFTGDIAGYCGR